MSSFTTITNDPQNRTQRRLLFEGFNITDSVNSSNRPQSAIMYTSTPDHKLHENENENLDLIPSNESQSSDPCLLQLQNARQLLHSMSRKQVPPTNEQLSTDDPQPRTELFNEANPELVYYKSSLESERSRRKQLETLVDVQQQRLTEAESELIQLRANDHKKTLCMKQLEQMIPNVVDEWKQKETEYKTKLNSLTQQLKQLEQTNREKISNEKQQFDIELNEKTLLIERLTRDNENKKEDYENLQSKIKQNEQRIQQLTKDAEQAKQRWSTLESDLRNEIKNGEARFNDIQSELDKKQEQIEQMLRDQHKLNSDHQLKIRQLENDLDEQRRENNVLKMELELREAKYRAQTESLKIQLMRDAETKLTQRLEEQNAKHIQIEQELNELHRRKLVDSEEKHEQIVAHERYEHENRVQVLINKLDQMKHEMEHIQSTTNAERQDLAKKLQDVFETTLFKGSTKANFQQNEILNPLSSSSSTKLNQMKLQISDSQVKAKPTEFLPALPLTNNDHPTNMSTIRSLSSRIESLVDQTNRVANGYEFNSQPPSSMQQENASQKFENNQNHLLSSQPHSNLHSPFYRSTPIDSLQEWYPQTISQPSFHSSSNQLTNRSQSADPITNSGLFSIYPSHNSDQQQQQQQHSSSNSFSFDSNLNINHIYQPAISSYRSTSSMPSKLTDHQQEVQITISRDSIENHQTDQTSSTNESLARYVKMLLERSPTQDNTTSNKHPLSKTNRSLHDIQLSIDQLNFTERDPKVIVDDLVLHNESHSSHIITPRQRKSSSSATTTTTTAHGGGGARKKLDYEMHNTKQSNSNDLFDRLSQPKTRVKKDKPKHQQPQQQQQQQQQSLSTAGGHSVWK
ncbi:unnamed protein product [Rotaria magnacalcarata]|uniref:Uncharacterized protein n=1 Tax=Rotaria magnacalcarata TaxID=392030 RepID=A0A816MWK7_9BILA|nr:unnamed protein product [Rotaria magnacalcarata]CAF3869527.1 unnamed protein product [Rotaria magnacalcarata]